MYPLTYSSSKTKKYLNIKRRNGEIHKIVVVNRGGKAAILEKLHARPTLVQIGGMHYVKVGFS
jgi:hypothetical protein